MDERQIAALTDAVGRCETAASEADSVHTLLCDVYDSGPLGCDNALRIDAAVREMHAIQKRYDIILASLRLVQIGAKAEGR